MKLNQQGFAPIIIIGIATGLLVTSTGVAAVANTSKPGDALYSIDLVAEDLQLVLAFTDGLKKEVHKNIAEERLLELQALYAEKELDAPGIANALSNFEQHKEKFDDLLDDDGEVDEQEQKLEDELEDKKAEIDRLSEDEQKTVESQRELLKQEYEQAKENGDTDRATQLQAQVNSFEGILRSNEERREEQKQEQEQQQEAESQSEAAKNAEEAQKQEAESRSEAAKNTEDN